MENSSPVIDKYFQQCLQQLNITPNQSNDAQLKDLLLNKLAYPSTQIAQLHMNANRLGTLDLVHSAPLPSCHESGSQTAHICQCCSLALQPESIPLLTSLSKIHNLKGLTRLLFISITHTGIIMIIGFLVHSLYAMISNTLSCNYNPNNLNEGYRTIQYLRYVQTWIFQVSLLSNISCMDRDTSYETQCWLAVITLFLIAFIIFYLKYRKLSIAKSLQRKKNSVQKLSIYIPNLPINVTKAELQTLLQQYRQSLPTSTAYCSAPIQVVKINRALSFYLSSSIFNHPSIDAINAQFLNIVAKLVKLVQSRRQGPDFDVGAQERKAIYQEYDRIQTERTQTYKRLFLDKLLEKANQEKQLLTSPAFVTFESSYNAKLLIDLHTPQNKILNKDKCLFFTVSSTGKKIAAIIEYPPKPQQVIWLNLGQSRCSLIKKKVVIYLISLTYIAGLAAGLYFLQQRNFQQTLQNPNSSSSLVLSFVVSIIIMLCSFITSFLLVTLTKTQRNMTYLDQQMSLNHKINIFQIVIFVVVPVVFHLFFTTRYIGIVSLSQTVFFLGLQNAFFWPALKLFDPFFLANRLIKKWYTRPIKKLGLNQYQLNYKFEYMNLNFGIEISYVVRSFIFTLFFAPLQPIIVVFTIAGLFLMFWIQKYCLLRRCSRPISASTFVKLSTNKYLIIGPILFAIGCLIWPYYIKKQFVGLAPAIIAIVVSVVLCVTPFEKLVAKYLNKVESAQQVNKEVLYSQVYGSFEFEYDRLNFLTKNQVLEIENMEYNQKYAVSKHERLGLSMFNRLLVSQLPNIQSSSQMVSSPQKKETGQNCTKHQQLAELEKFVYNTGNRKGKITQQVLNHLRSNLSLLQSVSLEKQRSKDSKSGQNTKEKPNLGASSAYMMKSNNYL